MVKFLVVRHGFSLSNKEKTFTGHADIDLSELGYKQADLVCDYVLKNLHVDEIYSSDLCRAYHTIEKVAKTLNKEIKMDKDLRELYCGKWQEVAVSKVAELYPEDYAKWQRFDKDMRTTGGESMMELRERANRAFDKMARENEGKTVLVATHGGVIRMMQTLWQNIPCDKWGEMRWTTNASITTVIYDGDRREVVEESFDDYLGELKTQVPKGM